MKPKANLLNFDAVVNVGDELNVFFFSIGPLKDSILLTTIYGLYFSHHYTLTLQITFLHYMDLCGYLLVYCINTCLSNLWELLMVVVVLLLNKFSF